MATKVRLTAAFLMFPLMAGMLYAANDSASLKSYQSPDHLFSIEIPELWRVDVSTWPDVKMVIEPTDSHWGMTLNEYSTSDYADPTQLFNLFDDGFGKSIPVAYTKNGSGVWQANGLDIAWLSHYFYSGETKIDSLSCAVKIGSEYLYIHCLGYKPFKSQCINAVKTIRPIEATKN